MNAAAKSNTPEERKFFDAIHRGDVEEVRALVDQQRELLDAYDYKCFGATPLTAIVAKDDREIIDALLDLGADPNRRSDWDMGPWSPLHCVIHSGQMEVAEHLLKHGADLDLHTAAAFGWLDEIKRLLDEAPDRISERGGDGCTPLHFVGTQEAAELLIDRGADVEARCIDHYSTPVQYLAPTRPQIARFLVCRGATPDIFSAALAGDLETIQQLARENPDVIQQRIDQETFPPGPEHDVHNIMTFTVGGGCTAIHAAARGNQPKVIEWLVQSGVDPNQRGGYDDAAPLHQVAWHDFLPAAKSLIRCGANIDIRSGSIHNNTPAGWAIVGGSADVFCLLMDQGCEVLDFFADDAQAGINGEFRQFKVVPLENHERIRDRILQAS